MRTHIQIFAARLFNLFKWQARHTMRERERTRTSQARRLFRRRLRNARQVAMSISGLGGQTAKGTRAICRLLNTLAKA